jgi:urease subunit alpha
MTPLFGATGKATGRFSLAFTSRYAWEHGVAGELGLCKTVLPVGNTRSLSKYDMRLNDYLPASIAVDPETFVVTVDGAPVTCDAAPTTPLAQRYYFY